MCSRFLSLLFTVAAANAAAVGSRDVLAPCDAVAAQLGSAATAAGPAQGQRGVDYDALLAPVVELPPPQLADPDLYARALQWLGSGRDSVVQVQHVDGPVWRILQVQGTAHCTDEKFFRVRAGGALEAVDTPAGYGDLCWNSTRDIGTVGGRTALIERELLQHPTLGLDVEITPWTPDTLATCRVSIRFDDTFRVSERYCQDPSTCRAAEPLAPKLAEALARAANGAPMDNVSPPPTQRTKAYAAQLLRARHDIELAPAGYSTLPTFGGESKTPYPTYAGSPQLEVIDVDGKILVARVGIGGVGWREIGDYLITLYEDADRGLVPVASFVVERWPTGLPIVTTSVPRPYVDTR